MFSKGNEQSEWEIIGHRCTVLMAIVWANKLQDKTKKVQVDMTPVVAVEEKKTVVSHEVESQVHT